MALRADQRGELFGRAGGEVDALRDELAARRPADGILGEEQGYEPGTSGITWVVDPIDGTMNFMHAVPLFAITVALERKDELVAAITSIGRLSTLPSWSRR